MKQAKLIFIASVVTALAGTSVLAQSVAHHLASAGFGAAEAPRVLQNANDNSVSTISNSHLAFVDTMKPTGAVETSTPMHHLQLMLKRSAARQAALDSLIADQHNPSSLRFHQWVTPRQYGDNFGVADSDIAAATSWLTAQGFTVNAVYPNKMQIDFNGTAGLVERAFHTQERRYTLKDGSTHVANATNLQIPVALKAITVGVIGLDDFHPRPLSLPLKVARWDAASKTFTSPTSSRDGSKGQAIPNNQSQIARLLVPNDLVTMYGIRTIRDNGVVGTGITIGLIEPGGLEKSSWDNFSSVFNLTRYGGTLDQINPTGPSDCTSTNPPGSVDIDGAVMDAEWATAIAPGAHILLASCPDTDFDSGVYAAMTNLVNSQSRPNIISVNYFLPEHFTSEAGKSAIDETWAQADIEGISVFVPTGNTGPMDSPYVTPSAGFDANALATSPNVTAVGSTDTADVIDGTTSRYFSSTPSIVGGSALSYVPEIPWNESCGNGVAAKQLGYNRVVGYCNDIIRGKAFISTPDDEYASGGAPSSVDAKPSWQSAAYNAEKDSFRDIPDVAIFGGSFDRYTSVLLCTTANPCVTLSGNGNVSGKGTEMSSALFAGVQALMDQGLAARDVTAYQGNAAPTLYALAAAEYGTSSTNPPASLSACNADNGATGTANCVFHNVTRGSISSDCSKLNYETLNHCYFYYFEDIGGGFTYEQGLTTADANPTSYGVDNKAYGARPGWSFASGLGSVNATNLLIAWRAFDGASNPAHPYSPSQPGNAVELY